MDEIEILSSARKHGIHDDRIRHVIANCPLVLAHPDDNGQLVYLRPDQRGVPLEVVAFEDDDGRLNVLHAMRLRPSYRDAYEEVMRWL